MPTSKVQKTSGRDLASHGAWNRVNLYCCLLRFDKKQL